MTGKLNPQSTIRNPQSDCASPRVIAGCIALTLLFLAFAAWLGLRTGDGLMHPEDNDDNQPLECCSLQRERDTGCQPVLSGSPPH